MREGQTDVLVVGAGPVGLWTALLLAKAGIEVSIIDREEHTAARSYACALHPRTLKLLQGLGLAESVLELGRRIGTVAFYDHESRRAELKLSELGGDFPFLLVLPQNEFERVLERRLRQAGVTVRWSHRFDALRNEEDKVVATLEELSGTGTGYIVPHWEATVRRRFPLRASFIVGTDGHNSLVRQRAGIESERVAGPWFFAVYEFQSDEGGDDEVRVVLDETTTNVLWPLPGNRYRWTFQLLQTEISREFPEKERRAVHLSSQMVDERIRQYVQRVTGHRAPWFSASVKELDWCTEVVFEHSLVRQFGRDRCWLAGDAAHQTGPVGVHSLNAGFIEGEMLVRILRRVLSEEAPLEELENYDREQRAQWRQLLGLTGGLQARSDTLPWVREHSARILPCLPATDGDLSRLAGQLKLDLK